PRPASRPRPQPTPTLFPYTTLFRSHGQKAEAAESRGAKDLRPVDDHPVADAPQRTFGEIAVSSLNCAEDGDQRLRPRVEPVDHLVDECGVDHLVPARGVAHRTRLQPRTAVRVGI